MYEDRNAADRHPAMRLAYRIRAAHSEVMEWLGSPALLWTLLAVAAGSAILTALLG